MIFKLFCFIRPLGIAVFLPFHKIIKIPFHLCFCVMRGKPWTPLGPRRRCWEEGGGKLRELYTVYSFLNSKEETESGSRMKSSPVALVRRWNSFSFSLNLGERQPLVVLTIWLRYLPHRCLRVVLATRTFTSWLLIHGTSPLESPLPLPGSGCAWPRSKCCPGPDSLDLTTAP